MLENLYRIFIGHNHEWETIEVKKITCMGGWWEDIYILKCKHCGKIKQKSIHV